MTDEQRHIIDICTQASTQMHFAIETGDESQLKQWKESLSPDDMEIADTFAGAYTRTSIALLKTVMEKL